MGPRLKIAIAVTLLIAVIFVVVHPLVDLEPTVLRNLQFSFLLLAVLALASTLAARVSPSTCRYPTTDNSGPRCKNPLSRLDRTCTFRC